MIKSVTVSRVVVSSTKEIFGFGPNVSKSETRYLCSGRFSFRLGVPSSGLPTLRKFDLVTRLLNGLIPLGEEGLEPLLGDEGGRGERERVLFIKWCSKMNSRSQHSVKN